MSGSSPARPTTLLLLIRHAEQITLREVDPPLSARGIGQAERLAVRLALLPITAIVTSPLLRTRQTAAPLANAIGMQPRIVANLEEVRMPSDDLREMFTGTRASDMEPDETDYVATSMAGIDVAPRFKWGRSPSAETGDQLRARTTAALDEVVNDVGHGIVACFTHGGSINSAVGSWLGISRDMWFMPWHTGITGVIFRKGERTVLFVNDTSHLAGDQDIFGIVSSALGTE